MFTRFGLVLGTQTELSLYNTRDSFTKSVRTIVCSSSSVVRCPTGCKIIRQSARKRAPKLYKCTANPFLFVLSQNARKSANGAKRKSRKDLKLVNIRFGISQQLLGAVTTHRTRLRSFIRTSTFRKPENARSITIPQGKRTRSQIIKSSMVRDIPRLASVANTTNRVAITPWTSSISDLYQPAP